MKDYLLDFEKDKKEQKAEVQPEPVDDSHLPKEQQRWYIEGMERARRSELMWGTILGIKPEEFTKWDSISPK